MMNGSIARRRSAVVPRRAPRLTSVGRVISVHITTAARRRLTRALTLIGTASRARARETERARKLGPRRNAVAIATQTVNAD